MTDTMVESLVRDSAAPLAAVELPSGRFLAVNLPLAKALGATVDGLTGSSSLDQLSAADRHSAELGFQALADGHLTGYQAIRTRDTPGNPGQAFSVWVNAVDVGGTRVGLISVTPAAGSDRELPAPPPAVRELGDVVLGTVDGAWRIDRISQDVTAFLGITPEQCVGVPVLGAIHPSDAPGFLAGVEHARRGERSVALAVRLSAREPQWCEVSAVFAVVSPEVPPLMAFALIRAGSGTGTGTAVAPSRESRLEAHLLRIADELHAAGLLPRLQQLPTLSGNPRLGLLTSREWAVLTRLLDGQRAAAIASDLVVSQSTVRNHLSSIYAKLRVDGQVDLIRTLRRETTR
jgi:DNA-binding CsgD family transcriptional regulator